MRILVEAYGCTMNQGEAGEFIDGLLDMGHELAKGEGDAEAFVIFTCGVIETTENHMLKRIGEFSAKPEKMLMVCGCLPNISHQKILKVAPHAIQFQTSDHMKALEHFDHDSRTSTRRINSIGILPIATGCVGDCSYCITKNARGVLRSRSPEELAWRLKNLLAGGAAEIQICAQDTAIYGQDIGTDLVALIEGLAAVEGDFMMRIGMMNPASVLKNQEVILQAFRSPKVFKFLHLPVQSGSDSILAGMKRHHAASQFEDIVRAFRAAYLEMGLSTDIIVGFPGETDDDFRKSLELVGRIKPDVINITRFSSRPGTEARSMKDRVPSIIAKNRSGVMTELRFSLSVAGYSAYEGRTVKALATERRAEGTTFLRTENYKPIVVDGEFALGSMYNVTIVGYEKAHLTGIIQ